MVNHDESTTKWRISSVVGMDMKFQEAKEEFDRLTRPKPWLHQVSSNKTKKIGTGLISAVLSTPISSFFLSTMLLTPIYFITFMSEILVPQLQGDNTLELPLDSLLSLFNEPFHTHVNVFLFLLVILPAIIFPLEFFREENMITEEENADKTKKKYTLTHKKYFNEEVTEVIMEKDDIQDACDKFARTLNELTDQQ